jgi:methyl-accepting chemotaxis protein
MRLGLESAQETEPEPVDLLSETTSMQIPKLDNQTILLAFAVVTGLAMLLQTIILLAISFTLRKAAGSIQKEIGTLRTSLMPLIYDTREILASSRDTLFSAQEFVANAQGFLTRVSPKVEASAGDLVEITRTLRTQTTQMQSSVTEILEKVRTQSGRVDHMVTGVLDTADRAQGFVTDVVSRPMRQISSILAVAKAVIETLRGARAQSR